MGNAVAKNSATEVVSQNVNEMQSVTNTCANLTDVSNTINIISQNGGTIDIGYLKCSQSQYYYLNASCISSTNISSSITASISQKASQQAKTISQNLDLNPGSTEAQNITEAIANSSLSIQNSVYNGCLQSAIAQNTVNITADGTASSDVIGHLYCDQDVFNKTVADCVFSTTETAVAIDNISQTISQAASATVQNAIGWILFAVAAILLVFFFITLEGLSILLWIFIILAILLLIYLLVAYFKNWWPYHAPGTVPGAGLLTSNVVVSSSVAKTITFTPLNSGSYQVTFVVDPSSPAGTFTWTIIDTATNQAIYAAPSSVTLFPITNPPSGSSQQVANIVLISSPIPLTPDTYTLKISTTNSSPLTFSSVAIGPATSAYPVPGNLTVSPNLTPLKPLVINVSTATAGNYNLTFSGTSATPVSVAPNTTLFVEINPISNTSTPSPLSVSAQSTISSVVVPTQFALAAGTSVLGIYVPTGSITANGISITAS